jgi:hypothetical protein
MTVTLIPFPRKGNSIIKTNFQHKSMGKIESAFYFGTEEVVHSLHYTTMLEYLNF